MKIDKRAVLEEAIRLSKEGDLESALTLLDKGLEAARTEQDDAWVTRFAKNAAFVCERLEDLDRALSYYRVVLQCEEEDRHTHLAIGGAYARKGDPKSAEPHLRRCLELALKAGDEPMVKLVQGMVK